jgi:hypothetical protein
LDWGQAQSETSFSDLRCSTGDRKEDNSGRFTRKEKSQLQSPSTCIPASTPPAQTPFRHCYHVLTRLLALVQNWTTVDNLCVSVLTPVRLTRLLSCSYYPVVSSLVLTLAYFPFCSVGSGSSCAALLSSVTGSQPSTAVPLYFARGRSLVLLTSWTDLTLPPPSQILSATHSLFGTYGPVPTRRSDHIS